MNKRVKHAATALFSIMNRRELGALVLGLQSGDYRLIISKTQGTVPRDTHTNRDAAIECEGADVLGYGYLMLGPSTVADVTYRRYQLLDRLERLVGEESMVSLIRWVDSNPREIVLGKLGRIALTVSRIKRNERKITKLLRKAVEEHERWNGNG